MSGDKFSVESSRRTLMKYAVGAVGAAAVGAAGIASGDPSTDPPETEWQRSYSGGKREYDVSLATVRQTDDGGFLLAGSGAPRTATGAEPQQFALIKTDEHGEQQWLTFVDDGTDDTTELHCSDVVQTGDGGFAVVGYADNGAESADDRIGGLVAVTAKVDDSGAIEWVRSLDAFEDDERTDGSDAGHNDDASFVSVAPAGDAGGFVAGGDYEYDAWYVRFTADGDVAWERRTADLGVDDVVARTDGGQLLFVTAESDDHNTKRVLRTDDAGTVQRRIDLDVAYTETPYNHTFVPTADGGYAYTGRDRNRENMVLGKLNGDGEREWRSEYDGPYEGGDWASHVVQTADGGYALGGYMSEAYTGTSKPTILKTDAAGTEQWRRLFTETSQSDVRDLVETADGGFAFLVHGNTLTKLAADETAPGSADDGNPTTATDSTATSSDNETEPSDTTLQTPTDGTETPTQDSCER